VISSSSKNSAAEYKNSPASKNSPDFPISFAKEIISSIFF